MTTNTTPVDYKKKAAKLIRQVRGKRSVEECANALDISVARFQRFEFGVLRVRWGDFVKLCNYTKIDLKEILQRILGAGRFKHNGCAIIQQALAEKSVVEIAKSLKVPRTSFIRWSKHEDGPDLCYVLQALDLASYLGLFNQAFRKEETPEIELSISEAVYAHMELLFIESAIDTDEYQKQTEHVPGLLSRIARTNPEKEDEYLDKLVEHNVLKKEGNKYVKSTQTLEVTGRNALGYRVFNYTAQMFSQLKEPRENSVAGFRVFPVSERLMADVRRALFKFYRELVDMVDKDDDPKKSVAYVSFAMIDTDELP